MKTNADITIYNRYYDKTTRLDKYRRVVLYNVFYTEDKASNRLRSGIVEADGALLLVPLLNAHMVKYVPPEAYVGEPDTFTFQLGDRMVKGSNLYEVQTKISEVDERYNAYSITSVDEKDFGSPHMRHLEIRGR